MLDAPTSHALKVLVTPEELRYSRGKLLHRYRIIPDLLHFGVSLERV